MTADLARAGGPIACLGLALLLAGRGRQQRLAGLAGWTLGVLFLALYLAPHGHHAILAAAAVLGLLAAAALAHFLRRWPWLLPAAALLCVPARIPLHVGSTQANLLLPLYCVAAAAAVLLGYQLVRGDVRERELGPIALPLAGLVAWTGLSLAWTSDLREGALALLFFWLPFGMLALGIARLPWSRRWLARLWFQLLAMALLFAVIGIFQYAAQDVFWNAKIIVGNAYSSFFRVNSVFYDPSIYGRFLVVAIVATLVVALGGGRRIAALGAAIAVIWAGLLFSFSQSSFLALIAGVLLVAGLAWRKRGALALGAAALVLLTGGFATPPAQSAGVSATSGRFKLVTNGLRIFADDPILGAGVGSFKHEYGLRLHLRGKEPRSAASHTTPVTVAAETGLPGVALFAWLIVAALLVPLRRLSRTRLIIGAGIAVIAVHSLFYNALFEDPMFWGLLGLAALAAREEAEA